MTNCFLGVIMVHDIRGHALLAWLLPTAILSGVWLLLGAALEVEKIKVRRMEGVRPRGWWGNGWYSEWVCAKWDALQCAHLAWCVGADAEHDFCCHPAVI
jgi:hypothetical protein